MLVFHLKRAMKKIPDGDQMLVEADDEEAETDIPAYCKTSGHKLDSAVKQNKITTYTITKMDHSK
jgi:TusA-related sulfurtransferase